VADGFPFKDRFYIPDGLIYLDGNSLGPLPVGAKKHTAEMMQHQWGEHLITAWNRDDWMQQPTVIGNRIGRLLGAPDDTVVVGDTLSIKVFQALSAGLALNPKRRVILSDSGNFPTDLYMAQGLINGLDKDYELRIVEPELVLDAIDDSVAVVMLTQVDYRSGRMHDMMTTTKIAHTAGAVMLWDLAHSAGAVEVDLTACNAEFAVGCTYKYLNGGPGAPAFIYTRADVIESVNPILSGWLGHDAPFAFEKDYRAGQGIERMRVGTPPVIQMAVLDVALSIWDEVSMKDVRQRSIELSELFIQEVGSRCPELELVSPRDASLRGSQVSFAHDEGYAVMQAVIDRQVIGDFRQPNIMRFGITPLFIDEIDILKAVDVIDQVLSQKLWDSPEYRQVKAVT